MNVAFHRVSLDVLEELVKLNHGIFEGMYLSEPYSLDQYKNKLSGVEPVIFVASVDGKIVGDIMSFRRDDALYVWILGIAKDFRGGGIASKLFDLTEEYARKEGFESTTTKVYNVSKEMLGLVKKRGYEIVKVEESEVDSKYDAVHLRLRLA